MCARLWSARTLLSSGLEDRAQVDEMGRLTFCSAIGPTNVFKNPEAPAVNLYAWTPLARVSFAMISVG